MVLVVELVVAEDIAHGGRGLGRKGIRLAIDAGREGVAAMFEHALREAASEGSGLDAQVGEDGVRPPTAEKANVVGGHASEEERGSAARAQRASRE